MLKHLRVDYIYLFTGGAIICQNGHNIKLNYIFTVYSYYLI